MSRLITLAEKYRADHARAMEELEALRFDLEQAKLHHRGGLVEKVKEFAEPKILDCMVEVKVAKRMAEILEALHIEFKHD